jgi:hypothetical protein
LLVCTTSAVSRSDAASPVAEKTTAAAKLIREVFIMLPKNFSLCLANQSLSSSSSSSSSDRLQMPKIEAPMTSTYPPISGTRRVSLFTSSCVMPKRPTAIKRKYRIVVRKNFLMREKSGKSPPKNDHKNETEQAAEMFR